MGLQPSAPGGSRGASLPERGLDPLLLLVCKDIFDQSVYIEFVSSRKMDVVLDFLVHAWQHLGLPENVQFENGRESCGFGHAARFLSRVIRLCLRLELELVFIREGKPQRNGSVENFNGRFQPLVLSRPFRRPCDVRRELRRLMTVANEQQVHSQLGYRAAAQYRRGKRLRKLPADFTVGWEEIAYRRRGDHLHPTGVGPGYHQYPGTAVQGRQAP